MRNRAAAFELSSCRAGLCAAARLLPLASLVLAAAALCGQAPAPEPGSSAPDVAQTQSPAGQTTGAISGSASDGVPATAAGTSPGINPGTAPGSTSATAPEQAPGAQAATEPTPAEQHIYNPNQVEAGQLAPQAPIDALILRAPQASTLNTNASSVEYADRHRRSLTVQAEASGAYTSNLYNTFSSSQQETAGGYLNLALPVGYQHSTAETAFNLYFRPTFAVYPSNTALNHTSQIFAADYVHNTSERTTWNLSLAGGRVQTVEGYLPAVATVGSTGVIQSNFSNGLRPLYNAASTFAMSHRWSERDTLTVAATAGLMQQPFSDATSTSAAVLYRNQTGGLDLQFQHAVDPRRAIGLELTNVYVRGLSPLGHSEFVSAQATYQQALRRHLALRLGGGPLYSQGRSPGSTGTAQVYSYIANGSLDYQTNYAHITAGYRRVLQLGYLAEASPANEYTLLFDRPITRTLNFTLDLRDVRNAANSPGGAGYSTFGLSGRLSLQATPSLILFLGGQSFNQSQTVSSLGRNDVTAGVTYTFGSGLARTGER